MPRGRPGPVPVVVMGLGFIGRQLVQAALQTPELRLVGAVDVSPAHVGQPLADLVPGAPARLRVRSSLAEALPKGPPAVLLHATGSRLPAVADQLLEAIRLKLSVVST